MEHSIAVGEIDPAAADELADCASELRRETAAGAKASGFRDDSNEAF
jgi:hypothetical protein